jgi:LacI family transcriptional regulator, repressor for deo operon, udp, cdd, tsx, nupC, and nupG
MRPRLRDIAASAGVSEATASRVLNRRPGVADETRRRVEDAIATLGYEPPSTGRLLKSGLVAVVVPELTNPVFPLFAQSIESALLAQGYTTVLCTATIDGSSEDAYVGMLRDRVAGFIFVSGLHADTTADHSTYFELAADGMPLVLINGYVEGLDAAFISADEAASAEIAVRHLADLGHTTIGCATGTRRLRPSARRYAGYIRGLRVVFGNADGALTVETEYTVEGGREAAAELLDHGATAIIAGSDLMALGAVEAARDAGLEVPRDVSVIGYDDTTLVRFTSPPLTTLHQPIEEMGQAAAKVLSDVRHGVAANTGEMLFRPELIVRESTGPPPFRSNGEVD